jgi:hypothetical protein
MFASCAKLNFKNWMDVQGKLEFSFYQKQPWITLYSNLSVVHDLGKGILISDTRMVLQNVMQKHSGNMEGNAESNPLNVKIICEFEDCSHTHTSIYHFRCSSVGENIGSNLSVLCCVDSFPEPSSFTSFGSHKPLTIYTTNTNACWDQMLHLVF